MYDKYLETNKEAKKQDDSSKKKASQERLAKNAAWNKAHKKTKE